jgi:hypothetical protein
LASTSAYLIPDVKYQQIICGIQTGTQVAELLCKIYTKLTNLNWTEELYPLGYNVMQSVESQLDYFLPPHIYVHEGSQRTKYLLLKSGQ